MNTYTPLNDAKFAGTYSLCDKDRTGVGSRSLGDQYDCTTRKSESQLTFSIGIDTDNGDDCVSLFHKGNGRVHRFVGMLDLGASEANTRVIG